VYKFPLPEKCYLPWKTGGGRRGRLEELDGDIQLRSWMETFNEFILS